MSSLATFVWADVCSRLGLGDRAGEFYELLEPFSSQLAVTGASVWAAKWPCIDPAAEIEERFGAPPWPRSAVAGTTDSTAGFAWMRAGRWTPPALLHGTRHSRPRQR
jgi:hypothetical protein